MRRLSPTRNCIAYCPVFLFSPNSLSQIELHHSGTLFIVSQEYIYWKATIGKRRDTLSVGHCLRFWFTVNILVRANAPAADVGLSVSDSAKSVSLLLLYETTYFLSRMDSIWMKPLVSVGSKPPSSSIEDSRSSYSFYTPVSCLFQLLK